MEYNYIYIYIYIYSNHQFIARGAVYNYIILYYIRVGGNLMH